MERQRRPAYEPIEKFQDFSKQCFNLAKEEFNKHIDAIKKSPTKPEVLAAYSQFVSSVINTFMASEKTCIRFFDAMPQEMVAATTNILVNKFQSLRWVYEHLFLDNKKQLIVYKEHRPLLRYLQRYRLPKGYEQKRSSIVTSYERLQNLIKDRNELISQDKDFTSISQEIEVETKTNTHFKKDFLDYLEILLLDFLSQNFLQIIALKHLRNEMKDDVRQTVQRHKLVMGNIREGMKYQWQVDIYKQNKEYEQREEEERVSQVQEMKSKPDMTKEESDDDDEPSQPNKIKEYYVDGIGTGQVTLKFKIPFNNLRPIKRFLAYSEDDDGQQFICQVPNGALQHELYHRITMKVPAGLQTLFVRAQNQIGEAVERETVRVLVSEARNIRMYMTGSTEYALIPKKEGQTFVQQRLIPQVPCTKMSINTAVMAIDSMGTLALWGNIFQGMQDNEAEFVKLDPIQIEQIKNAYTISCGESTKQYKIDFYLVSDAEGNVWGFGLNNRFQLGLGDSSLTQNTKDPVKLAFFPRNNIMIREVAAGFDHSLALDTNGNVYVWGANQLLYQNHPIKDTFGSVINYTIDPASEIYFQTEPRQIKNNVLGIESVRAVRASRDLSAIVSSKGELLLWGSNEHGQLGCGQLSSNHEKINYILIPISNPYFKRHKLKVVDVRLGSYHSLAITQDQKDKVELYSWGSNLFNQCGQTAKADLCEPTKITFFDDHDVKLINAGGLVSVVLTNKGLYIFGDQDYLLELQTDMEGGLFRRVRTEKTQRIRWVEVGSQLLSYLVQE